MFEEFINSTTRIIQGQAVAPNVTELKDWLLINNLILHPWEITTLLKMGVVWADALDEELNYTREQTQQSDKGNKKYG